MDEDSSVDSLDEALMYVTANRVGVFRRGKSKCKVVSIAGVDLMLGSLSASSVGRLVVLSALPHELPVVQALWAFTHRSAAKLCG
jgi:hypothetical protein